MSQAQDLAPEAALGLGLLLLALGLAGAARGGRLRGQPGWGSLAAGALLGLLGAALALSAHAPGLEEEGYGAWIPLAPLAGGAVAGLGLLLLAAGAPALLRRLADRTAEAALQKARADLAEARLGERSDQLRAAEERLRAEREERAQAEGRVAGQEGRWRSLLEQAPGLVLTLDPEGTVVALNRGLPGTAREEVFGTPLLPWLPTASQAAVKPLLRDAFLHGRAGSAQVEVPTPQGPAWFAVRVGPVRRGPGEPVAAVVAILTEVTEWRQVEAAQRREAEAEERARRLEEAHRFRTELLHTAAHELNNPLTPIRTHLHLLRVGGLDGLGERQRRSLEVVERNVQRIALLVQDMRDASRVEGGKLALRRERLDLSAAAQDAVETVAEQAAEAGVALEVHLEGGLACEADPQRLQQVLANLLGNALKFTPRGGRVAVETRRLGDHVGLRVADTGPGLAAEQMAQLFQPFRQVGPAEQQAKGTGLGLYICKGIVEQHGGRIWVESAGPGKGAAFAFTLPAAPGSAAPASPATAGVPARAAGPAEPAAR